VEISTLPTITAKPVRNATLLNCCIVASTDHAVPLGSGRTLFCMFFFLMRSQSLSAGRQPINQRDCLQATGLPLTIRFLEWNLVQRECTRRPLWVISRLMRCSNACPLYTE
jgi:hypothetical protein